MAIIRQGQNEPLLFVATEGLKEAEKFSASLIIADQEVKEWTVADISDRGILSLPLTEEETMKFRPREGYIDAKYWDSDGDVHLFKIIPVIVEKRGNRHRGGE